MASWFTPAAENVLGLAPHLRKGEHDVFGRDIFVLQPIRFLLSLGEDILRRPVHPKSGFRSHSEADPTRDSTRCLIRVDVRPNFLEEGLDYPFGLLQQRGQHMERKDLCMIPSLSQSCARTTASCALTVNLSNRIRLFSLFHEISFVTRICYFEKDNAVKHFTTSCFECHGLHQRLGSSLRFRGTLRMLANDSWASSAN